MASDSLKEIRKIRHVIRQRIRRARIKAARMRAEADDLDRTAKHLRSNAEKVDASVSEDVKTINWDFNPVSTNGFHDV